MGCRTAPSHAGLVLENPLLLGPLIGLVRVEFPRQPGHLLDLFLGELLSPGRPELAPGLQLGRCYCFSRFADRSGCLHVVIPRRSKRFPSIWFSRDHVHIAYGNTGRSCA